jgi:hypothetical protein
MGKKKSKKPQKDPFASPAGQLIMQARQVPDHLEPFEIFRSFERDSFVACSACFRPFLETILLSEDVVLLIVLPYCLVLILTLIIVHSTNKQDQVLHQLLASLSGAR